MEEAGVRGRRGADRAKLRAGAALGRRGAPSVGISRISIADYSLTYVDMLNALRCRASVDVMEKCFWMTRVLSGPASVPQYS